MAACKSNKMSKMSNVVDVGKEPKITTTTKTRFSLMILNLDHCCALISVFCCSLSISRRSHLERGPLHDVFLSCPGLTPLNYSCTLHKINVDKNFTVQKPIEFALKYAKMIESEKTLICRKFDFRNTEKSKHSESIIVAI